MVANNQIEITLVGAPNSGKTSLFNCLTGQQNKVGNWDGVTIDLAQAKFFYLNQEITVKDLPGCYSLISSQHMTLEEKLVCKYLNEPRQEIFINVVSLDNLSRDLYVTLQLLEQNFNVIIVINIDNNKNYQLYRQVYENLATKITNLLGCRVVCCNAFTGFNTKELKTAIIQQASCNIKIQSSFQLPFSHYIPKSILEKMNEYVVNGKIKSIGILIRFLEGDVLAKEYFDQYIDLHYILEEIDLTANKDIDISYCVAINKQRDVFFATKRHEFIKKHFVKSKNVLNNKKLTNIIDKIVIHKYLGLPIFFGIIYTLFLTVFKVVYGSQYYLDKIANILIVEPITTLLTISMAPDWLLTIFKEGIAVGFITVFNFIPALLVMHIGLFILENSGYISRSVFLIDRFMGLLGLPGQSLVPMIIGFGCNVPAISGAKIIEQKRDKIITILMLPFMSCNARLAVYSVFTAAFFIDQSNVIFYLYLIGILLAILTGFFLQLLLPGSRSNLIMSLPTYKIPAVGMVLKKSIKRVKEFLVNSGVIVICLCTLISAVKNLNFLSDTILNNFLVKGLIAIFKPMGVLPDNWQAIAGLFSGLIAKETIIGSLNALYGVDNIKIYGVLHAKFGGIESAFAYLLFVLLCFPCVSVVTNIAQELNKKWAIFSVVWTTSIAYTVSVCYYQIATFNQHPEYSIKLLLTLATIIVLFLITVKTIVQNNKAMLNNNIPITIDS